MSDKNTIDEILDFAISEEEKAAKFYSFMAGQVEKPWMKELFNEFAKEEEGHKAKLLEVKNGKLFAPSAEKVVDLKIANYAVDIEPAADISYQDALILAMKKEKAAFKLYSDMAASAGDEGIRNVFLALAQEEAKHKLRFEVEYDEKILTEN